MSRMATPQYFDYHKSAREAGINADQLHVIERLFRADYPTDDMLYELHVLRACNSVRDGLVTLDAILREAAQGRVSAA